MIQYKTRIILDQVVSAILESVLYYCLLGSKLVNTGTSYLTLLILNFRRVLNVGCFFSG